jgi:hypothetical protein
MAVVVKPEPAPEFVSVTVTGNYQVAHEGIAYGPGEVASVPPVVAATWLACGWVEPL